MTLMYNQGVVEQVIVNKSRHLSLDGLRAYEHLSSDMYKAAELIIADLTKCFEDIRREQDAREQPSPMIPKQEHHEELSPRISREETSPTIPHEDPPTIPTQHVPGFSGLNYCTITCNIFSLREI